MPKSNNRCGTAIELENGHSSEKWNLILTPINKQMKLFTNKYKPDGYFPVYLNNNPVQLCQSQKHLGLTLDEQLNFNVHVFKKS